MRRILVIIFALFALSSCSILNRPNDGVQSTYLNVKIFQTQNKYSALAFTNTSYGYMGDVVDIITTKDIYYDGLVVYDSFVLVGTFSYVTKKEVYKTVPVYMKLKEYRELVGEGVDINKIVSAINGE